MQMKLQLGYWMKKENQVRVYRSNKHEVPIVLYDYHSTRSGDCPKEFLKGYSGYLESDAYDGYNKVET